jgi:hypothetical protein
MDKILVTERSFSRVKRVLENQGMKGIEGCTIFSTGMFFLKMDCPEPTLENPFCNRRYAYLNYSNTEGFYISVAGKSFDYNQSEGLYNELSQCRGLLVFLRGICFTEAPKLAKPLTEE